MHLTYPAVFTPKPEGGYRVNFPDLKDCVAEGPDLEDSIEHAKEAAIGWIEVELEEDGELPPRSLEADIALEEGQFVRMLQLIFRSEVEYD